MPVPLDSRRILARADKPPDAYATSLEGQISKKQAQWHRASAGCPRHYPRGFLVDCLDAYLYYGRFRVDVSFIADLALMEKGDDDFTALGTVRRAWIKGRCIGTANVEGEYADIYALGWVSHLRTALAEIAVRVGMEDIDLSSLERVIRIERSCKLPAVWPRCIIKSSPAEFVRPVLSNERCKADDGSELGSSRARLTLQKFLFPGVSRTEM
jgi:hypothetical protein